MKLVNAESKLCEYYAGNRLFQGIASMEKTPGGRLFCAFYSGGTAEMIGNYALLVKSDDDGETWSDAIAAVVPDEGHRCFDDNVWIDPMGRAWFWWSDEPRHSVWFSVCDSPDEEKLTWSEPRFLGEGVMMNKPTVLKDSSWLFPVALWHDSVSAVGHTQEGSEKKAFVYRTADGGKTFEKLGGADVPNRSFDEHMILERADASLAMYVRTHYGIALSISYDGGVTWSEGEDSGIKGPDSRFFIRRLSSGRVLLVNHYNFTGRSNMTAMLSEDDGKTWLEPKLLLDARGVSYPDGTEDADGNIYIVCDNGRGYADAKHNTIELAESLQREVLIYKFTEKDILSGKLVTGTSYLAKTVSKLGKFTGDARKVAWKLG